MNDGLTVSDLLDLERLVIESLWRVDHGKAETVYELYTEDGEMWYDGQLFCKGHEAIKEWGSHRYDPRSIRHLAMNLRFDADGPDRAVGSGVEMSFHAEGDVYYGPAATLPQLVGEWDFEFVRTDAGWRFACIKYDKLFDRRESPPDLF
jgi:hypothetical protein